MVPSDPFLKNLYSKVVPAGRSILAVHNGLDVVYDPADRAIAEEVDQEPNWLIDPVTKTFCPYDVVTNSLKVTGTVVAVVAQAVVVVVEVVMVLVLVVVEGAELVVEVDPPPVPSTAISAQWR